MHGHIVAVGPARFRRLAGLGGGGGGKETEGGGLAEEVAEAGGEDGGGEDVGYGGGRGAVGEGVAHLRSVLDGVFVNCCCRWGWDERFGLGEFDRAEFLGK